MKNCFTKKSKVFSNAHLRTDGCKFYSKQLRKR